MSRSGPTPLLKQVLVGLPRTRQTSSMNLHKLGRGPKDASRQAIQSKELPPGLSLLMSNSKLKLKEGHRLNTRSSSTTHKVAESETFATQKAEELIRNKPVTQETFDIFKGIFSELIVWDVTNSTTLSHIKMVYEEWIAIHIKEVTRKNQELDDWIHALAEEKLMSKAVNKKLIRLTRGNIELNNRANSNEGIIIALKEEIKKRRISAKQASLASKVTVEHLITETAELRSKLREATECAKVLKEGSERQKNVSTSTIRQEVPRLSSEVDATHSWLCESNRSNENMESISSNSTFYASPISISEFYDMPMEKLGLFEEISPIFIQEEVLVE